MAVRRQTCICNRTALYKNATLQELAGLGNIAAVEPVGNGLGTPMMVAIFATLLVAFILELSGLRRLAVSCLFLSLALCVGLFLWEVYSPEYGFHMPWLRVEVSPIFALPRIG